MSIRPETLAVIGDVHLDRNDPALPDFIAMLDRLGQRASRIVLMGDLFNIWIGRRELEMPHQSEVLEAFRKLRARGVILRYVEGNRDYRIGKAYAGDALDDSTAGGLLESFGGRRIYLVHGHLANPADRQYRAWHRLSRSAPFWWGFHALPRGPRARWIHDLERKMRSSNLNYKGSFPEGIVREYAAGFHRKGHDVVVLGHFHTERDLQADHPPGRILVLPEWKGSRRHLEFGADGRIGFVDSER